MNLRMINLLKPYLFASFFLSFIGEVCVADEASRYDLRVRLQPGQAYAVRQLGENDGTIIFGGRKSRGVTTGTSTYEIRVLEVGEKKSKISVTFGSQKTSGTSGGITLYAPFSAIVEKPTAKTTVIKNIEGQSQTADVSPDGRVSWNLPALDVENRRYALNGKTPAEKSRIYHEWEMLGFS